MPGGLHASWPIDAEYQSTSAAPFAAACSASMAFSSFSLSRSHDLGGGVGVALVDLTRAPCRVLVLARRAAVRRRAEAVLGERGEADVVAADPQRHDLGVGVERVELRRVWLGRDALRLGHVA